jgi:hypothetical protein
MSGSAFHSVVTTSPILKIQFMKHVLALVMLVAVTASVFGQRKMNWTMKDEIQRQLGIPFQSRSNNEIDLRIFVDESLTPSGQVLWLRQKGKEWKATLYTYVLNFDENGNDTKEVRSSRSKELLAKSEFSELWAKLVNFDVLTLINQADVAYELQKEASLHPRRGALGQRERHHSFMIFDGVSYDVLVRANGKSRSYSFHSPCTHLDYFPESKELKNYCNILSLLEKEFKIEFE